MNLNQNSKRFESFQQKIGITDIIQSKSLLGMIKAESNERLPIFQEKILFASIEPGTKVLSALGHFELLASEGKNKLKEKTQLQKMLDL
jgi:hypothetical protein